MGTESRDDALTALAIGLGTMKAVDLAEEVLLAAKLSPPKWVKSAFAVSLAATGTAWAGHGGIRRRALVAGAAMGASSLLHAAERLARYRGDEATTTVISRASLRRP